MSGEAGGEILEAQHPNDILSDLERNALNEGTQNGVLTAQSSEVNEPSHVIELPENHPIMSGNVEDFDKAVRERVCKKLNEAGAIALKAYRTEYVNVKNSSPDAIAERVKQLAANDSKMKAAKKNQNFVAAEPKNLAEQPAQKSQDNLSAVGYREGKQSIAVPRSDAFEASTVPINANPERLNVPVMPESVRMQLDRDIQEVLFKQSEVMSQVAESEAVEPHVQLEAPQVERVISVDAASEPELPPRAVIAEADIEAVQAEDVESEFEGVELVEPTPGMLPVDEVGLHAPSFEETGTPEAPETIVELLVEPLPETGVELETGEFTFEQGIEEVPPFSTQLEKLVAEAVEPERQETVATLIAQVYELVAQAGEELEPPGTVDLEQAADTPGAIAELEEAVTELLHELGVEEPSPEQIERFVALVRADQRCIAATEDEPTAVPSTHDLSQSFTNVVSARYQAFMRLHHPLGRAALAQPIAA